jgi:Bifunctional DNA primase/polymerase, N-terminal
MARMKHCLDAALELAAAGLPVFPCLADKRPATRHGFKDACADSAALRELWRRCPGTLAGVPTGELTGVDILDFAKHPSSKDWYDNNRHRLPDTRSHQTRFGGLHLLFKCDALVRGTAGKIAPGVDTRGVGNYLIWWPATGLPVPADARLAPWPDWLLAEFRPKQLDFVLGLLPRRQSRTRR